MVQLAEVSLIEISRGMVTLPVSFPPPQRVPGVERESPRQDSGGDFLEHKT